MSHHVYHTRALVMRGSPSGEADTLLELFTEDWGRITAHARGLRREGSRLRYVLQPMSWVRASVVRSAGGWRLTTANPDETFIRVSSKRSLARVSRIIRQFFPREIASPQALDGLLLHTEMASRADASIEDAEALTLAKLFQHLGYWSISLDIDALFSQYKDEGRLTNKERAPLVDEINRILRTVHT
jgi:recombinational DNA repair protein (RecF pathway)